MAKPAIPSDISPEAEDFLLRTFEINHEARPSAADLLQHAWIVKGPSSVPTKSSSAKPKGGKGA
jgi:mitogen-activated protein kinase kinase kinase